MKRISAYRPLVLCFLMLLMPQLFLADEKSDHFKISQIFPIDRGHSYMGFSIKYMGFAQVRGRFEDFSGAIRYDENDISKLSASIIIKTASIDTDHNFRDRDLKSANWFDAENYPEIKFQTKSIDESAPGIEIIGDLTIKNVTKEVRLKLEGQSGLQKDIRGDSQIIFTASTTIDRTEFGVKGERWSRVKEGITGVASEVKIELSILAKQLNLSNAKNWVRNVKRPPGKIYKEITENGVASGLSVFDSMRSAGEGRIKENTLIIVGNVLLKEGNVEDAISVLKHNISVYPESADAHASLGEAYAIKADYESARTSYENALAKDSLNTTAVEVLRHLKN